MVDARDVTVFGTLILPGDSVEHGVTVKVRCYPAEDPCTREGQRVDHRAADPARTAGDEHQRAAHARPSGS